jgi:four helix bundle protein
MAYRSFRDLEIYQLAHQLGVEIHKMTLEKLPKFELYEEGSQLRRSSKSISANIVEGFGLRRYKNEFIKYLTQAQASCDESQEHIKYLFDTKSLTDEKVYNYFIEKYQELGRKINRFIASVEIGHLVKDRNS